MERVPFFDLRILNQNEKNDLISAISAVFDHGRMIIGPEVVEFETTFSHFCNRKYGVGVDSGTNALFLGLKSLGIGLEDEVITTSMSWIATANAIAMVGATPIFTDVCDDLNINPDKIEALITKKTKAIIPVHFTGKICKMDKILNIASQYGLKVIEDASQAFGATYQDKVAGSFGDMACFSLNPMKVLGACGEAGIIVCDDKATYDRLISLRYNGTINRELCVEPSLNGRIDTLQAAILLKRFKGVPGIIAKRREIANFYGKHLKGDLKVPQEHAEELDTYYSYTICTDHRDQLKSYLEGRGVETKIQHLYLMSDQPAYQHLKKPNIPNASKLIKQIICLPNHEKLSMQQLEYVTTCVNEYFSS